MKAAPQDQWKLLDLAETDRLIARRRHDRKVLPQLDELRKLAGSRQGLAEDLVAKQTVVFDLKADQKRIEADLAPARARLERNQATVDAGQIDHKALRGLTDEIEHLKRRIGDLEDAELDIMQRVEEAEAAQEQADEARKALDGHIREVLASRDHDLSEIDAELKRLVAQRTAQAGALPADLLKLYQTLLERTGMGAGRLEHGVCSACGIVANPGDQRRYDQAPADEVLRCEECDRIMVRPL